MPTIKQMYKQMKTIEQNNPGAGAFPIMFKNPWERYKFQKYVQYQRFMERAKKICHL